MTSFRFSLVVILLLQGILFSETLSLDGEWEFLFNRDAPNIRQEWTEGSGNTVTGKKMRVPGSWPHKMNDPWREGKVWYRKKAVVPEDWKNDSIYLHTGAASLVADVWVAGKYLGRHLGGYTAFEYDITDIIKPGVDFWIVYRINNRRLRFQAPSQWMGWLPGGGLTRSVYLKRKTPLRFESPVLDLTSEGGRLTLVAFNDSDKSETLDFTLSFPNHDRKDFQASVPLEPREKKESRFSVDLSGLPRWSPEQPTLVPFDIHFDGQVIKSKSGLRVITWDQRRIYLDGKHLWLEGFGIHAEHPERGVVYSEEEIREQLSSLKNLGANFVRLGHYPFDPKWLDICDELGLVAWMEIPVWQIRDDEFANSRVVNSWMLSQMREMILQYRHHPSVFFWSNSNECGVSSRYYADSREMARQLDGTRPVSFANSPWQLKEHWKDKDVNGLVTHFGWFHSKSAYDIHKYIDEVYQQHALPFLNVELCGKSLDNVSGSYSGDLRHSPAYHDKLLRVLATAYLAECERTCGFSIWTLNDFRGPYNDRQRYSYGARTIHGEPKFVLPRVANLLRGKIRPVILDRTTYIKEGESYKARLLATRPHQGEDRVRTNWKFQFRRENRILFSTSGSVMMKEQGAVELSSVDYAFDEAVHGRVVAELFLTPEGHLPTQTRAFFDVKEPDPLTWAFVFVEASDGSIPDYRVVHYGNSVSFGNREYPARIVGWEGEVPLRIEADGFPVINTSIQLDRGKYSEQRLVLEPLP